MKKVVIGLVVIVILATVIVFVLISGGKKQKQTVGPQDVAGLGSEGQQEQTEKNLKEEFKDGLMNSKQIIGNVGSISIPSEGNVIFLQVEASLVSLEGLDDVDLFKQGNNLPMEEKTYTVAIDDTTKIKNVGKKEDIKSGDTVVVTSDRNVYEIEQFTATEVIVTPQSL